MRYRVERLGEVEENYVYSCFVVQGCEPIFCCLKELSLATVVRSKTMHAGRERVNYFQREMQIVHCGLSVRKF